MTPTDGFGSIPNSSHNVVADLCIWSLYERNKTQKQGLWLLPSGFAAACSNSKIRNPAAPPSGELTEC